MLDGMTLDQLRTFIAAVEEGSFSAAGRKLGRTQSVVSYTLATLEGQLGVRLFERGKRAPVLTAHGEALLRGARSVAAGAAQLKAHARSLAAGVEPLLCIVVDVLFPATLIAEAVADFRVAFALTPLQVGAEALGGVFVPVLAGSAAFGIAAPLADLPPDILAEPVCSVPLVHVVGVSHPLARYNGIVPRQELAEHVQLVLTDRSSLTAGRDAGIFSRQVWRLPDLGAKHAFLRAGLGFGSMPLPYVEPDLASGTLRRIELGFTSGDGLLLPFSAVRRRDTALGPAAAWLLARLRHGADSR